MLFSLYLLAFTFGGLLIGVSMFLGGADKDFDKDVDLDADADGDVELDGEVDGEVELDGEAELDGDHGDSFGGVDKDVSGVGDFIWLPIFSMRFWTFGSAAFGFTGIALTLASLPWLLVFALATLFGGGAGTLAAYFFRMLKKDSVTGSTSTRSYVGEEALVVLPIEHGGRGKIMLRTAGGDLELIAITSDTQAIARGDKVLIAGFADGIADVSRLKTTEKLAMNQPNRHPGQTT